MLDGVPAIATLAPNTLLQMARQHQASLDQLEEILCGSNRPSMDDAAAAVIALGAHFQLLVQELEKLT